MALFFAVALCLRICLPYDEIFRGDWIKFAGTDIYYEMRLVDNLVHNFPHLLNFDPYFIYPGGGEAGNIVFFDYLLASIIWVIGLGSPTQHTIDVVSVYFPAILGALTVIPVYFIGKELFNRWVGVLSAGLIAILPGDSLGRSILGHTEHHVAETLFTTVALLFLILAIKAVKQKQLTFSHLKHRDWATIAKPIIYSLLAGIFLGLYIFTWLGALLFIFIIFVFFVIQFIIDHLKGKSTDYLCLVGVTLFLVTLIMSLLISPGRLYLVSLIIALLMLPVSSGISWLMATKKIKPAYYPLTMVGLGLAGLGLFYLISPTLLSSMLGQFSFFFPTVTQLTTIELQSILTPAFPGGGFFVTPAWTNFTTGFFLSFVSLGMLIYLVVKQGSAEKSLLVVWSLLILAATLALRRFGYYFAVNVALLTGYVSVLVYYVIRFIIDYFRYKRTDYMSWQILELPDFEELTAEPVKLLPRMERKRAQRLERKKTKLKTRLEPRFRLTITHISISLCIIVIFFVVFFPNIKPAIDTASRVPYAPSDAWVSSPSWMRENTPEPFGNPDLYYQLEGSYNYRSPGWLQRNVPNPSGDPDFYYQLAESHKYPESAYGVLAWWDYGYWITRIAHRIPIANPSQDPGGVIPVASFFTSQDEKVANEIIGELDSPYIIVDYDTAYGKFYAIVRWAEKEENEFLEIYYGLWENQYVAIGMLFYPEYYRSLSTRLYNFDCKAVTPGKALVVSYEEKTRGGGSVYKYVTSKVFKEITSVKEFDSYEEAEAYLLSQESANYKIGSANPFISPVPLEALEHYKLIHSSESTVTVPDVGAVPEVKIFEYID